MRVGTVGIGSDSVLPSRWSDQERRRDLGRRLRERAGQPPDDTQRLRGLRTGTTAFEPRKFFADGDMVVALGHYTFRVVKTGKTVDNDRVHSFELEDGKISTFEGYEDSAAVVAAFTAMPD